MSIMRLNALIHEGKTVTAKCPRCDGNVTVPTEVVLVMRRTRYEPSAQCHRCGVGFSWHTEINPTGSTAIRNSDRGLTNVWFCDRVMDAPAPTIVEEQQ